jgi:hypothetical protein
MQTDTLLTPSGDIDPAAIADKAAAWAAERSNSPEQYRRTYLVALDSFNLQAGIEWGWHHKPELMRSVSRSVCTKGD